MKRMVVTFIILGVLIVYSVCSESYLVDFCDETYNVLEICGDNIKKEAYAEAEATADKLLNEWEKRNLFLSIIIGDSAVSESYGKIVAISRCLKDSLYDDCLMLIRECQGIISETGEENRINLDNIL